LRAGGRGNAKKLAAATVAAMGVATAAYLWNQKQKQKLLTPLIPLPKNVEETERLIEEIRVLSPEQYKQKRKSEHLPCSKNFYLKVLTELAEKELSQAFLDKHVQTLATEYEQLHDKKAPPLTPDDIHKLSIMKIHAVSCAFISVMDETEFNLLLSDRQLNEEFEKFKTLNGGAKGIPAGKTKTSNLGIGLEQTERVQVTRRVTTPAGQSIGGRQRQLPSYGELETNIPGSGLEKTERVQVTPRVTSADQPAGKSVQPEAADQPASQQLSQGLRLSGDRPQQPSSFGSISRSSEIQLEEPEVHSRRVSSTEQQPTQGSRWMSGRTSLFGQSGANEPPQQTFSSGVSRSRIQTEEVHSRARPAGQPEGQERTAEKKLLRDKFGVLPGDEPNVPNIKLVRDAIERTFFRNCPE